MILSLQGCMAAGKTSAARYLAQHAPYIHLSYEDNAAVAAQVRQRGLDKHCRADYIQIQRLYIEAELRRWEKASAYPCTVMDFGAEEIEFYTLNYPKTLGADWDIERALAPELAALRRCMPARILFLDASEATLRRHKEGDASRSREFFDYYLQKLLPLKRAWFSGRDGVDWLCVDGLRADEAGAAAKAWADGCLAAQK